MEVLNIYTYILPSSSVPDYPHNLAYCPKWCQNASLKKKLILFSVKVAFKTGPGGTDPSSQALRRLRQKGHKYMTHLGYGVSSKPDWIIW